MYSLCALRTTEVYQKPTHTEHYLIFESPHPVEHKLGVIRTLQRQAENISAKPYGKEKTNM